MDIIKKTYNYIIKNDVMPTPKDIDNNSIIINFNPYIFREYCKLIDGYKIFFTNCIDRNKIKTKRFDSKYKIEKININDYCIGEDLINIDKKLYNELALKLNI